jgi:hypothetical protein
MNLEIKYKQQSLFSKEHKDDVICDDNLKLLFRKKTAQFFPDVIERLRSIVDGHDDIRALKAAEIITKYAFLSCDSNENEKPVPNYNDLSLDSLKEMRDTYVSQLDSLIKDKESGNE